MKEIKLKKKTQSKGAKRPLGNEPVDNLRAFIAEADLLEQMTSSHGWGIVVRDFGNYRKQKAEEIPYLDKNSAKFDNAVLEFRAIDKLFKLIEDYSINKKIAMAELETLENTKENIVLDVDN